MKNLFSVLAVLFGGFVVFGSIGIIFALYKINTARNVAFLITVICFALFAAIAIWGVLSAAKRGAKVKKEAETPEKTKGK